MNDLKVKLTADTSSWSQGFKKASIDVTNAVRAMKAQFGGIETLASQFKSFGTGAFLGLSAPILAAGTAIFKARGDIEALEKGLTAVTGSAQETAAQFARLREVAKLPGLGLKEAIEASVNLQAAGRSASQAERYIMAFGNALALVGRGKEDLNEVLRQLTQLAARGKVTSDNLKPIIERVPQAAAVIRKEFGTLDTEVLQKMGISSEKFISVLIAGLEKLPKATGGMKNEISNISDSIQIALNDIGKTLEPVFYGLLKFANSVVDQLGRVAESFAALTPTQRAMAVSLAGIVAGIPVAIIALGSLAEAVLALKSALSLAGIALGGPGGIAVGIASLAAIIGGGIYSTLKLSEAFESADQAARAAGAATADLSQMLRAVDGSAQAAKESMGAFLDAAGRTDRVLVEIEDKMPRVIRLKREDTARTLEQAKAHREHAAKLQTVVTLQERLAEAIASIRQREGDAVITAMAEAMASLGAELPGAISGIQELADDLARSGVSADESVRAIERYAEGLELLRRAREGLNRVEPITMDIHVPRDTMEEMLSLPSISAERAAEAMERIAAIYGIGTKQRAKDISDPIVGAMREISSVFTDLSRDLASLIVKGGSFKEVMVNAAESIGTALLRLVIQRGIQPMIDGLSKIIGMIPGLGKIADILSGGSAVARAGAAASSGGAASSASGILGQATGGILGSVTGVVSAISGVIGIFQNSRQEGTLNAIEHETRYTQIHALNILEKLNAHLPSLDAIHLRLMEIRQHGVGVYPQPGWNWNTSGSGGTVNIQIGATYGGPAGIRELTNEIVAQMRLSGVLPR